MQEICVLMLSDKISCFFFKKYTTRVKIPDKLMQCPNGCIQVGNNGLSICNVGREGRTLTCAHFLDRAKRKLLRHMFTITSLCGIGRFVFIAFLRSSARCSPRQAFLRSQSIFLSKNEAPAAAAIAEKPPAGHWSTENGHNIHAQNFDRFSAA